ncbi:MAG: IS110 family transposase [Alphaproteobacteria bacterium RIFCSPHIGHO2_12_42_13]|nr:MAG: IS110 family transposase [Alphaproteobacteria bacterium RIFCSPHIGHO2_12_FULL_42_100]OFW85459.1 MAG: IS110 family transposase [Alphaproteobacteria bacterium RBG_16_42_14]OFW91515.1 MAG: IS110 family transposase [Alphaproteobacteria bacterium RIFCSPHIGHO2_02_FULL_42_30]OFW92636.1 MAG: IS110 family transposase [Alphaproteobacteria bacterium RIFCSPHIGHO2_12_42_13]
MTKSTRPFPKKQREKRQKKKIEKSVSSPSFEQVNPHAAGIDIGSKSHFVAVRTEAGEITVKEFDSFTSDLYELSKHLKENKVTTVAMESTGVYWIPLYDLLEEEGFEVKLVNARHVKNVTGRKTDVEDCQWLQKLHSFGLLSGAFRVVEKIRPLRAYSRQRSLLIESMAVHIQHMQKALFQMNIQLTNVLSDITGLTGMQIIRAIVAGQRDPKVLAQFRDRRCAKSVEEIEKSLTGHWKNEHLFSLQQALELYDFYQKQILHCDEKIKEALQELNGGNAPEEDSQNHDGKAPAKSRKPSKGNALHFDVKAYLQSITGVDLTRIPGIDGNSALKIIGEIGADMSPWKSAAHFTSWMGLSPENKISGGKRLSSKTKPTANRVAQVLRMAASTLYRNDSAMGGFLRRMKSRLGAPQGITATARKLAVLIYTMLKNGTEYVEAGLGAYEKQYEERLLKNLKKQAAKLGLSLVPSLQNQPPDPQTALLSVISTPLTS